MEVCGIPVNFWTISGALIVLSIIPFVLELLFSLFIWIFVGIGALFWIICSWIKEAISTNGTRRLILIVTISLILGGILMLIFLPNRNETQAVEVVNPITGEIRYFKPGTQLQVVYADGSSKEIPIEKVQEFVKKEPQSQKKVTAINMLIPED